MAAKRLRAVGPDEAPPTPKRKLTILEAAQSGTVREQYEATRDRIARALDDPSCSTRDLASLSKRLMEITAAIDAIDAREAEESDGAASTPDDTWQAV